MSKTLLFAAAFLSAATISSFVFGGALPAEAPAPPSAEEPKAPGQGAQPGEEAAEKAPTLTEAEVTAVMESTAVKEAFYECASLHPHPEKLVFSFIVNEKGKATLFATEPEVSNELFSCFRAVSRAVEFEPMDKKFEVTYPMKLPKHLELKAGKKEEEKKKPPRFRKAGWALFSLGGALLVAGGATGTAALVIDGNLEKHCPGSECGPDQGSQVDSMRALALSCDILLAAGGASLLTGIILLAVGRRVEKKSAAKPKVSIAPPAGIVLTWRF